MNTSASTQRFDTTPLASPPDQAHPLAAAIRARPPSPAARDRPAAYPARFEFCLWQVRGLVGVGGVADRFGWTARGCDCFSLRNLSVGPFAEAKEQANAIINERAPQNVISQLGH